MHGKVAPIVNLANFGANQITAVDIVYHVNGEAAQTVNWTGSLNFLEDQIVELPEIDFSVLDENNLVVYLENPNGTTDEYLRNDTIYAAFDRALIAPGQVKLMLKLDDNPEDITWDVTNSNGDVLFSGGPYTEAGAFIQETMDFEESDCHIFSIYDEGGDGLATPGFFTVFYGGNTQIVAGTAFGSMATAQFSVDLNTGVENQSNPVELVVFPNPALDQISIVFSSLEENDVHIDIRNLIGQSVMQIDAGQSSPGSNHFDVDLGDVGKGIYLMNIRIGHHTYSQKISVIR